MISLHQLNRELISMSMIQFKHAELNDLPRIIEIYNSTISSRMVTADLDPITPESRLPWFHEHNKTNRPLYVLLQDKLIVGWISFQSFYGRPAYHATAEVSIYLDEVCRGQGVGQLALEKAINECPSLGIKNLLGFIFGHNLPSIRLFSKFGFEQWACLPDIAELDGVERDLLILGKRIE